MNKEDYGFLLTLFYIGYIIILVLISILIIEHNDWYDNTIRKVITNFKNMKGNYQRYYQELQVEVNRLMELINSNEEYRNKFNELYEENKFLLDNPEELYRRINDLSMQQKVADSKKLIREFKEKKNY